MRRQFAVLFPLVLVGTAVLTAAEDVRPDSKRLVGIWDGTRTRIQAGRCSMNGQNRNEDPVRVTIRPTDDGKVTAGFTLLPAVVNIDDNATIRVHRKKKFFFDTPGQAFCGGVSRKYTVKHEITEAVAADGTRTLRFVGKDDVCPQSGCSFQMIYDLTYKDEPK